MRLIFVISALALSALGAAPAEAGGDAAAGKTTFLKCQICHSPVQGKNVVGPSLFGIVGRPSASIANFNYSDAMKAANKTWDEATLDVYLTNPKAMVPGTKMMFAGLPNADERANLIAFLATLK